MAALLATFHSNPYACNLRYSIGWYVYASAFDKVVYTIEELQSGAKAPVSELVDLVSQSTIKAVKVGLVPYALHVRLDPARYSGASWLDMAYFNSKAQNELMNSPQPGSSNSMST